MIYLILFISLLLSAWLIKRKNLFGISSLMGSLAGLFLLLSGVALYGCFMTVAALITVIDLYVFRLRKHGRAFTDYRFLE